MHIIPQFSRKIKRKAKWPIILEVLAAASSPQTSNRRRKVTPREEEDDERMPVSHSRSYRLVSFG